MGLDFAQVPRLYLPTSGTRLELELLLLRREGDTPRDILRAPYVGPRIIRLGYWSGLTPACRCLGTNGVNGNSTSYCRIENSRLYTLRFGDRRKRAAYVLIFDPELHRVIVL